MFEQVDQQVHGKQQHSLLLLLLNFGLFKLFVYERVCVGFFLSFMLFWCCFLKHYDSMSMLLQHRQIYKLLSSSSLLILSRPNSCPPPPPPHPPKINVLGCRIAVV